MKIKLDKNPTEEERKLLDQAKEFSLKNDLEKTLEPLQKLIEIDDSCGLYHGMMGNILWSLKRFEEAEEALRNAINILPESEPVSTNMFHVLWEQDKNDEAFEEIKRFVKLTGSTTYDEIIQEINKE